MIEVIGLKLTNGFEVIAKLDSTSEDGTLNLEDAFFIQAVDHGDGGIGFQYMPITYLGKMKHKTHSGFDFALPPASILFRFPLNEDIVEDYRQKTSPIDLSQSAISLAGL